MLLAQLSTAPTGHELASWLICGAAVTLIINQLWGVWDKFRQKPAPAEVEARANSTFATQARVESIERKVDALGSELRRSTDRQTEQLEAKVDELRQERREDINTLHEKINQVAREVSALQSSATITGQRQASMDGKIDRILERCSAKSCS